MEIAEKFLKERGMERQWNDIEITFQGMINLLNDFAQYKVNELNKSDVKQSLPSDTQKRKMAKRFSKTIAVLPDTKRNAIDMGYYWGMREMEARIKRGNFV